MKPIFCISIAYLLLSALSAFSQSAKIDSLKRVIETTKVDTVKGRTLCALCWELVLVGELEASLKAGTSGTEIMRKANEWHGLSDCLNKVGLVNYYQGNYESALDYYTQALEILVANGQSKRAASVQGNIGNIYFSQGNYPKALSYFQQSLKSYQAQSDKEGMAHSYNNIGNIHFSKPDYLRAAQAYRSALGYYNQIGDTMGQARALNNLGNIFLRQNDLDSALNRYERALQLMHQQADRASEAHILASIGIVHSQKGRQAQALTYFEQALKMRQEIGDSPGVAFTYSLMAEAHLLQGQAQQSRLLAHRGLDLARSLNHLDHQLACAQALYQADSALGNWKSAFEAHVLYKACADSLKNDAKSQEMGRLEAQYEADKERELLEARQQSELQQRNWMLGSAGGGLLLLLIVAFTLFRSRQKEKNANAALRLLNEQIGQQKSEIEAQNSEITAQRDQLNATNERLLELDRMKEQLTGMIVHDLKNPLNAVLAMASMPPDANRLGVIRGAGQQMSQLVLNLLDVQKYEEAALGLKTETAAAAELLHRATQQTTFLADQKQIAFRIEADPRLTVEADAELVVRVLVNLLTNAIKYAPVGDAVEISALYEPQRGAVFRVTDHGRGVPADQLGRIFDKFAQIDGGQTSGKMRSTGLGLTFCKLTVEAHGGSITVLSEVGQHTTFEFDLPKASLNDSAATVQLKPALQYDAPLPANVQALISDPLNQLRQLPPYDLTTILDLLDALPDRPDPLSSWKAALEEAALSGNEARYSTLLG